MLNTNTLGRRMRLSYRVSLLECLLLNAVFLLSLTTAQTSKIFLEWRDAVQVLKVRRPRANFFLEEMLPGNLERECYEETCSQEEAAEIFQTKEKTMEFWYRYKKVFECQYKNGGCLQYCTDIERTTGVMCSCAEGYHLQEDGKTCKEAVPFPCGKRWQGYSVQRSALEDVFIRNETQLFPSTFPNSTNPKKVSFHNSTDQKCNSTSISSNTRDSIEDELSEGFDMKARIVGGQLERQGGSPWQVLIHKEDGFGFCGGTLIMPRWVISAAHCFQETPHHVTIGKFDKMRLDQDEQMIRVKILIVHPHFHEFTFDSDIALLYLAKSVHLGPFATPACLPNIHLAQLLLKENKMGTVSGWGATQYMGRSSRFLRKVELPVVDQKKCILSTEQVITDNMFCAGYDEALMDACSGDSGGPFVSKHQDTWYLIGVVSWGEMCAAKGKYGVYTKLDNYLSWIKDTVLQYEQNITEN
ncbi:coagulation factor X isoform X2 [Brienomyrus brachyistius]|uniref:coagulation factor X isoform X2 n=1 Tax=Brienomyrus brachyistius TaxID=42636 RepID=UPI0020B1E4EE|nr:coagulation factor X isoform X2 [Brienomyrus brachyistius]